MSCLEKNEKATGFLIAVKIMLLRNAGIGTGLEEHIRTIAKANLKS
jgi:hypothetical protein